MFGLHLDLGKIRAYGSAYLASILYQDVSGDFLYTLDDSSNMILDNQSMGGEANDGLLYSGRGIELGATNDVDIPIHHTLGADNKKLATSVDAGWTDNLDNTYTGSTVTGDIVGLTTLTSGTFKVTITLSSVTAGDVNGYTADGTYVFEETLTASLNLTGTGFTGTVELVSAEQITNPNSYLTYYDFTDGLVTVDNSLNTPSTKYTLNTKTINNVITHTTQWSASDWTKINNNPNLIGKLALETTGATKTIPELDMVMDAGASADSYYMCSEKSGAYLVDSRVAYGADELQSSTTTATGTATMVLTGTGYNATGNSDSGFTSVPRVNLVSLVSGKYYVLDGSSVLNSGAISSGTLNPVGGIASLIPANGEFSIIFKATGTNQIQYDGNNNTFSISVTATVREATATEIANYAETIRTNADLQQKGIQTTAFVTDGAGTPQSYTSNILNYDANSYTDTQWNPSLESAFWLEEVIDGVVYQHKYDGTNLTTYTDNVAGTPTAHSPENASYLLGKGVYPKVTADPYTTYQSKTFQVYTGSTYTNYNQASRYAILAAL